MVSIGICARFFKVEQALLIRLIQHFRLSDGTVRKFSMFKPNAFGRLNLFCGQFGRQEKMPLIGQKPQLMAVRTTIRLSLSRNMALLPTPSGANQRKPNALAAHCRFPSHLEADGLRSYINWDGLNPKF